MELFNTYIPREYLALKINYLRQQLEELPVVTLHKYSSGGNNQFRVVVNNHKYGSETEKGKENIKLMHCRERLADELNVYQAIWDANFKYDPPADCEPHAANRVVYVDTNKPVIMNKEYFDSLENDADTSYAKPDNYEFNGIKYRSAAEKEIAIFYTESGIPFKYEPKVFLKGLAKPVFPDFVPYFTEIDTCKFHEHFGMTGSSDYFKVSKLKFGNFMNAGLIQDLDVIFTTSNDDTSFDPRHLSAKLNAAIYGTIIISKGNTNV